MYEKRPRVKWFCVNVCCHLSVHTHMEYRNGRTGVPSIDVKGGSKKEKRHAEKRKISKRRNG